MLDGPRLLFFDDISYRYCVPRSLVPHLLHTHHDLPIAGHVGVTKLTASLTSRFYWRGMHRDIEHYVHSCQICQMAKPSTLAPAGLLRPLPVPTRNWQTVGLDFMTNLPVTARGHNGILVFTCHLSRMAHAIPIRIGSSELTATEVARIYFDNIFRLYGWPSRLVSDRDPRFTCGFWQELLRLTGTSMRMSTPHHPQTDGLTERVNLTLCTSLRTYVYNNLHSWDLMLSAVNFAYNNSLHSSIGCTPFFAMYGFHPSLPDMPEPPYNMQAPADFIDNIHRTVAATRDALLEAQIRHARIADRARSSAKFVAGQYVYLSTKHLNLDVPHKFKLRYLGPFRIRSVTSSGNACDLELPHTLARLHATRNTSELKLATLRDTSLGPTPFSHPAPQPLADGETYFVLDRILDSRVVRNTTQYRCSYLGYEPAYDEWVPEARLRTRPDGPAAIAAYLAATAPLPATRRGRLRRLDPAAPAFNPPVASPAPPTPPPTPSRQYIIPSPVLPAEIFTPTSPPSSPSSPSARSSSVAPTALFAPPSPAPAAAAPTRSGRVPVSRLRFKP